MADQNAPPSPAAPPAPSIASLYGDNGGLVAAPPTQNTPAPEVHQVEGLADESPFLQHVNKAVEGAVNFGKSILMPEGKNETERLKNIAKNTIEKPEQEQTVKAGNALNRADAESRAGHPIRAALARTEAGGHALASAIPLVGPYAADLAEQTGTEVGQGRYAEAAGDIAGNAAILKAGEEVHEGATKGAEATVKATGETAKNAISGAGPEAGKAASATAPQGSRQAGKINLSSVGGKELRSADSFGRNGGSFGAAVDAGYDAARKAETVKTPNSSQPETEIKADGPEWERTHTAVVDGKKVGSVGYKIDPDGRAQIYGSNVSPELRGKGIGQKLYRSAIEDARNAGASRITSDSTNTTPDANRVWEKLKEKGLPVEEITHPNGKPGYEIDFDKANQKIDLSPAGGTAVAEPTEGDTSFNFGANEEKSANADNAGASPNADLQASAQKFAKAKGMPEINHSPVEVDADRAKQIANTYDAAEHAPNDPKVKAAYDAFKTETMQQFDHLTKDLGIKFEPQEADPYTSAAEMMNDVKQNKRLKVFSGSGPGEDHPLAEVEPKTGATYNTIFRFVHDLMGHAAGGHEFTENGEKSATESHAQMYSDTARPAMRAETEGQTSWFFHNPEVEAGRAEPGQFAPQKATIIPDESKSGYHPTLQKLADKFGTSDDAGKVANGASFIAPDGKFIHLGSTEHNRAVEAATGVMDATKDNRPDFLNDTQTIRTRMSNDRAGKTLHVSVPTDGITPEQVDAVKAAVRSTIGKNGNIVMETADGKKSSEKQFVNANAVEPMMKEIGVHPEQHQPWHEVAGKTASTDEAGGIDPRTGKADTTGTGSEIMPELRKPLDHAPTAEDFKNFYDANKVIFDKYPELRIGWDNNTKVPGGHEINVGSVGPDAARLAKKLDQTAAWDIGKKEVIPTGGSGLRTEFPNYSLDERIKDLKGDPQSNIAGFEHLSPDVHDNLEPDERDYLKGNKTLQRNVMSQYHKIDPAVNETTNAMQAGAALGGWWQRYIDVFHNLTDGGKQVAETIGPSHAEVLKQWHAALSGNKSVQDANNLAWHSYADWLDAGKPTDRASIDSIVRKNGAQPLGSEKKGNAAISDTLNKKGKMVTPGLDTTKLFNLVNSPEMQGKKPFGGDVFSDDTAKNPLMGTTEGARKIPSMGATVAGKGNLNRLVIDAHIRDFYGHKNAGGPAAQYIADSVHLRQAAKDLGLKGGEGQEQLWGTVLGLKQLLKEGLTPEEASGKLNSDVINSIGKDYAEVIANDPEITQPGGVLDKLKDKYGIGRGSAGAGAANRSASGSSSSESGPAGGQAPTDQAQLAKTAQRILGQISAVKIKKPAPKAVKGISLDFLSNPGPNAK